MNKEWVISDLHFYHTNIIKYTNRPFKDISEMNQELIIRWNNKVKDGHDVFVLGDFSLSGKDNISNIVQRLNGNKILIKGNHDSHSNDFYRRCGFVEVSKYPIIIHEYYILSHNPVYLNSNMPYINLHGHTHNTQIYCIDDKGKNLYYNCCVENHDYKPIDFSTIVRYYDETNNE